MRVLYSWLKEYIEIPWEPAELAERLTMAGLEVEEVAAWPPADDKVIVGKITAVERHPDSDHLFVCRADIGERQITVVCGAPNTKEGLTVPVARPGAELAHAGGKVEEAVIRGVASEGIICSEKELGISDDHSGIMILSDSLKPGNIFRDHKREADAVLDIFITPNRGDCLSIIGIAREIAALTNSKIRWPEIRLNEDDESTSDNISVELIDVEGCPRYSARIIKNLRIADSPFWMKDRLEACGVRSINNIVDITNYVLLEVGQPLHAFDLKLLTSGTISVRAAAQGESMISLDNVLRELCDKNLLICDGDRPVALAGVMGGANSEVIPDTENILLESAFFEQKRIRQSSAHVGLSTEASRRFEKGIDPTRVDWASNRASALLQKYAGGRVLKGIVDENRMTEKRKPVAFRPARCNMLLGIDIELDEIRDVLMGIECTVDDSQKDDAWEITVPAHRWDLTREVDLIEEVSRIIGFERIHAKFSSLIPMDSGAGINKDAAADSLKQAMLGLGFYEIITNIMGGRFFDRFVPENESLTALANPLNEDMRFLRPSLIPSLIEVLEWNKNRDVDNVRIFEIGKVFSKIGSEYFERHKIAGLITGELMPKHWSRSRVLVEFYDFKGIIETILRKIFLDSYIIIRYDKVNLNNAFSIMHGSRLIGYFGELPADYQDITGGSTAYVFEFDADVILRNILERVPKYRPISRFPNIKRDLVFLADSNIPAGDMQAEIMNSAGELLKDVAVFDLYEGKQVPEGKKSIGFSLIFGSEDRTLPESEVNEIIENILGEVKSKFGADLRPQ